MGIMVDQIDDIHTRGAGASGKSAGLLVRLGSFPVFFVYSPKDTQMTLL